MTGAASVIVLPVGPVPDDAYQVLHLLTRASTRASTAKALESLPGFCPASLDQAGLVAEYLASESGLLPGIIGDEPRHALAIADGVPAEGMLRVQPKYAAQGLATAAAYDLLALKESVDTLRRLGSMAALPLGEIINAVR